MNDAPPGSLMKGVRRGVLVQVWLDKSNTRSYTYDMKGRIASHLVEWDDEKNTINIRKHGISFETAALVFADEERIEYFDRYHSGEEDRYITIGRVEDVLFVVYTDRGDASRLISARLATKREKRVYDGDDQN